MKKSVYVIIGLMITIVGILFVTAVVDKTAKWHSDSDVSVNVDGTVRDMTYAVENNLLKGWSHTYGVSLPMDPGHNVSEIWVSVQDGEMSLLQALSSANRLCPASLKQKGYTGPTNKSNAYHYATELEVVITSVNMSLQDAIDAGRLCYSWSNWTQKSAYKEWRAITMSSDGRYQTAVGAYGSYSTNPNRTYVSSDYGNTWVGKPSAEYWIGQDVAMSSDGRYQTTAGSGGAYQYIYVSTDYGNTWTVKFNGGTSLTPSRITMSPTGINQFAVVYESSGNYRIYASTDYGNNWAVRNISKNSWNGIAMSSDGAIMTAVASGANNGIYVSKNLGATWTKKYSNSTAAYYLSGIAMSSDGKYQTAIVGTSTSTGKIYISSDSGETWTAKESNRNWMDVAMSSDGRIQTAVDSGTVSVPGRIYISTDYGNTWTPKSTNRLWYAIAMSSDGITQTAAVYSGYLYLSRGD
ncbi:MAG: hypothetical protein PHQ66_02985 [Candidatus Nanoarchaeia archaeon]|nr:hypothetical protein [Candidatus Nanoarchaeia archaeon]MDD5357669.1 hypothetical protein [Candidatus Nanoarchaeia archaeon]MDD5588588.1 hypothetical protein [Candidatus Nanoarchaeia archaeon]